MVRPLLAALGLVVFIGVSPACSPTGANAGLDAGVCSPWSTSDAGAVLRLVVRNCASTGSRFIAYPTWLTVFGPDGGAVSLNPECMGSSCGQCGSAHGVCDPNTSPMELQPGRAVLSTWDGRSPGRADACPDAGEVCHWWEAQPPGAYRARFCAARTATVDAAGRPETLGPLECLERPLALPFESGDVVAELTD